MRRHRTTSRPAGHRAGVAWLVAAALGAASGCSRIDLARIADTKIPGVYRLPVQQGNVLDAEALAKLEPGMTKRKVSFLIGTPAVQDVFHQDRWDYVYTYQPGGGKLEERAISLFFVNDKLARVEGDIKPERKGHGAATHNRERVVTVPPQPHHQSFLSALNPWSDDHRPPPAPSAPPGGGQGGDETAPSGGARAAEGPVASATPPAAGDPGQEETGKKAPEEGSAPASDGGTQAGSDDAPAATAKGDEGKRRSLFQRLADRFSLPDAAAPEDGLSTSVGDSP